MNRMISLGSNDIIRKTRYNETVRIFMQENRDGAEWDIMFVGINFYHGMPYK